MFTNRAANSKPNQSLAFVSQLKGAAQKITMTHIVLLGDSVFDNAAYVAGGPDVLAQLRAIVPQGWQASLNARDGAGVRDVYAQLDHIPNDATHLVVSAGGNDALGEAAFLEER